MATTLARKMVTQWGLSDEIGPVLVGDEREEVFLGHSMGKSQNISEKLMDKIDSEIRKFVNAGYETAKQILGDHIDELHKLSAALIEKESLSGDEMRKLLGFKANGKKIKDTNA
jgi:cell division protease FtsH